MIMAGVWSVARRRRAVGFLTVVAVLASGLAVMQVAGAPPAFADPTSYDGWVLSDSPLGYWRLDELSGSEAEDAIENNRTPGYYYWESNSELLGDAGLVNAGRDFGADAGTAAGIAEQYDPGLQNTISAAGTALEVNDFSFEFWIDADWVDASSGTVLAEFGAVSFVLASGQTCDVILELAGPEYRTVTGGCTSFMTQPSGGAHHVVFTKDHTSAFLYVDGRVIGSVSTNNLDSSGDGWIFDEMNAALDNIAVYGSALSATQVNNHYWASPHAAMRRTLGSSASYVGYSNDPVNTATGGFTHEKNLVPYPSYVYGMGATAVYNRLDERDDSALGLGAGWVTNLDSSIRPLGDGSLVWQGPDGREVRLLSSGTNTWNAPEATLGSIRKDTASSPTNTWVLQFQSGERWEYDSAGRLVRRCEGVADWATRSDWTTSSTSWTSSADWCGTSGTGQYTTIAWTANSNTQPATLTSSNGMVQTFTYDATTHRLKTIQANDDGTSANYRYVRFGYGNDNTALQWVSAPHFEGTGPNSELGTSTTAPLYPFERYTLDGSLVTQVALTAGLYQSTGDIPDTTKSTTIVANTYDGATGRVLTQIDQIGNTTTFVWNDSSNSVDVKASKPGSTFETVTYEHDSYGHLTSMTDPNTDDTTKLWSQGSAAQVPTATPTHQTDRIEASYGSFYDSAGRLAARAKPDPTNGFVPPLADHAGPETCKRGTDGTFPAQTSTACDVAGKRFGLETWTYVNSVDTRVDTYTDAAGQKTKYTYSGSALQPSTVTTGCQTYTSSVCSSGDANAPAVTTTYTYSGNLVTSVTDGAGVKNCTAYNSYNQVIFTTPGVSGTCPTSAAATSTVYTYTALGKVRTVAKPSPQGTWTYTYYGTGQPKTVADPISGHDPITYSYSYLAQGYAELVTDEMGQTTTTTTAWNVTNQTTCNGGISGTGGYDPDGNSVFMPCKTVTTAKPSPAAAVTQISDANGDLRLTATPVGSSGARSWNVYGNLGRLSKSFTPEGVETRYTYDANGRLTGTQNGNETGTAGTDATASTSYDYRGRVTQRSTAKNDAGKVTTKYAYDQNDRVIQEVGAAPDGTFPTQNSDGTYPAPTSSGNNWTFKTTTYAPTGAVTQTALYRNDSPAGPGTQATVAHTHDAAGRETCVDTRVVAAATGYTETHTYRATDYNPTNGYVLRTRIPIASVSSCSDQVTSGVPNSLYWAVTANNYNYDGSLNWTQNPVQYATLPTTTDANHVYYRTTFGYDAAGRQTSVQSPDPSAPGTATVTSSTCYTPRGEVRAKISPNGSGVSVVRHDYFGQSGLAQYVADPTAGYNATTGCATSPISSPTVGVAQFGYDGRGNRTSRKTLDDAGTGTWQEENWTFDLADRPTGYTSNTGTAIVSWTASYGLTSGRLSSQTTTTGADADSSVRRIITAFAPSGSVTQVASHLCGTVSGCSSVTNDADHKTIIDTTYDPLGRKATVTDNSPGVTTNNQYGFAYNAAGNITQITYPNAVALSTTYNLTGQPTGQTYPDGNVYRYRYDMRLALTHVDVAFSGSWLNLAAYTNNANGQRSAETLTGATASSRTWTRNGATDTVDKYTQVLATTTSITTPITYDNAGRIASDCKGTGTAGACQSSDIKTTYTYDADSQLLSATVANDPDSGHVVGWAYTYGNHGNRTQQTVTTNGSSNVVTHYRYDSIETLCASKVGSAPSSCTDTSATRYAYDGAGRLTTTTPASGSTVTSTYDPRGLQKSIQTGASYEYRAHDPLGQWNCFTTSSSGCSTRAPASNNNFFYWDTSGRGIPQIVQWIGSGTNYRYVYGGERISLYGYYFSNDYQGSTLSGPAASNAPTGYSPYGEQLDGATTAGFRYRSEMQGQGQLYLRARNYNPAIGLFTSRDKIDGDVGDSSIANSYHYVTNDPINLADPSGFHHTDADWRDSLEDGQPCGGNGRLNDGVCETYPPTAIDNWQLTQSNLESVILTTGAVATMAADPGDYEVTYTGNCGQSRMRVGRRSSGRYLNVTLSFTGLCFPASIAEGHVDIYRADVPPNPQRPGVNQRQVFDYMFDVAVLAGSTDWSVTLRFKEMLVTTYMFEGYLNALGTEWVYFPRFATSGDHLKGVLHI